MAQPLYTIVHQLNADPDANLISSEMIGFVFQRIADLDTTGDKGASDTLEASAALAHLLKYDAGFSASVRERMLEGLQFDPPLYGLLHASAAVAHCDGACTQEAVFSKFEAGVQPGADTMKCAGSGTLRLRCARAAWRRRRSRARAAECC